MPFNVAAALVILEPPTPISLVVRTPRTYSDDSPDDGGDTFIVALGNTVGWNGLVPVVGGGTDTVVVAQGDGILGTPGLTMTSTYSFINLKTRVPFLISWHEVTYDQDGVELSRVPKTYQMTTGADEGPTTEVEAEANQSIQMEKMSFAVPWLDH